MRRFLLVLSLLVPQTVWAWGNLGHQTVGAIADTKLTPAARTEVRKLLGKGQSLMSVATKADQIRSSRPETAPWHFVDIPKEEDAFDEARDCANDDCVIDRIEEFKGVLADTSASKAKRKEALIFLVHFVGDLHQPMHCAEATLPNGQSDRGGNSVKVKGLGQGNNLHRVWDASLLEEEGLDRADLVSHLLDDVELDEDETVQGTPREWAEAAHKLARDNAYDMLQQPGNKIDQDYIDTNIEVVDQQLWRAGIRLAHIINEALAP